MQWAAQTLKRNAIKAALAALTLCGKGRAFAPLKPARAPLGASGRGAALSAIAGSS
jgi:hypothetical protein